MRISFVAAFIFVALSSISDPSYAQTKTASVDGTDSFRPYFGVWKGTWHTSGVSYHVYTRDANVVVCIGSKFESRNGDGEYFGWMNSHSDSFGSVRNVMSFVRELELVDGVMTFQLTITTGKQYATVKMVSNDQLDGMVKFVPLIPVETGTEPAKGTVALTKVRSLGKNGDCPSSAKWPVQ